MARGSPAPANVEARASTGTPMPQGAGGENAAPAEEAQIPWPRFSLARADTATSISSSSNSSSSQVRNRRSQERVDYRGEAAAQVRAWVQRPSAQWHHRQRDAAPLRQQWQEVQRRQERLLGIHFSDQVRETAMQEIRRLPGAAKAA
mmetsp:Transcript_87016/g.177283  ORF Transcript_87016/g.177283 Transcript_87016/m.177283 type:complete len:147 (-) Transcript_87016:45-485(-)